MHVGLTSGRVACLFSANKPVAFTLVVTVELG